MPSARTLLTPLPLPRGPPLKNRILLAPLTNWQSKPDGTISEHEEPWLSRCAAGGFSMVMTCAAHVQRGGQTFPGQMGIFSDAHLPGLRNIANSARASGAVTSVQLHHGGLRANPILGGFAEGPSDTAVGRALSTAEVEKLRDDFITAALRAQQAGFDGVEVHGAFGWVFTQFLSPTLNTRTDKYGGASLETRSRLLFEVIDGIRNSCKPDFQIGLRLSTEERYGVPLLDLRAVAARALKEGAIDYLDLAVWDYRTVATVEPFAGRNMMSIFTELPKAENVRIGASGHVMNVRQAVEVLDAGCDFVMLGKAAILDPDFVNHAQADHEYRAPKLPVTPSWLRSSGLSEPFIEYMRTWEGFVDDS
ncbi:NADH:flavin oxidoreductase/NADH oxidase [Aspergillus venezuelensis]